VTNGLERPDRATSADGTRPRLAGEVIEVLPNAAFRVRLADGHLVTAHVAGTMRPHYVRLVPGDRVEVEVTRYDTTRARIVARVHSKG
jgi:translation initiation factor IF-1